MKCIFITFFILFENNIWNLFLLVSGFGVQQGLPSPWDKEEACDWGEHCRPAQPARSARPARRAEFLCEWGRAGRGPGGGARGRAEQDAPPHCRLRRGGSAQQGAAQVNTTRYIVWSNSGHCYTTCTYYPNHSKCWFNIHLKPYRILHKMSFQISHANWKLFKWLDL